MASTGKGSLSTSLFLFVISAGLLLKGFDLALLMLASKKKPFCPKLHYRQVESHGENPGGRCGHAQCHRHTACESNRKICVSPGIPMYPCLSFRRNDG
ncbi:hypothetical protein AAFF_G00416170 [Aldrovandia affinis]|uniref:Uncharacterized protein n=1 Tax=Aldrovandia affinis TaxID=143900 RepID=A0AAD7SAH6_9TELE|nr:hypothetical protein AAFF_G00416170 [Aldrovandia affinis]